MLWIELFLLLSLEPDLLDPPLRLISFSETDLC